MHPRSLLLGVVLGGVGAAWGGAVSPITKADAVVVRDAPSGKASVAVLARGEAAFVGRLTLAAGAVVPEHQDAAEEIIHVLRGGGTMTMDGVTFAVGAGDTVVMPADATVTYANGPAETEVLQVFAGPGPAAKYDGWAVRPR